MEKKNEKGRNVNEKGEINVEQERKSMGKKYKRGSARENERNT